MNIFLKNKINQLFSLDLNTRDGTNIDAAQLEGTFNEFGFDTQVYHNQTAFQILRIVEYGKIYFQIKNFYI